MAKFLCKECRHGLVYKIEGSEIERAWCSVTEQYLVGKVIKCSHFNPRPVPKERRGK